MKFSNILKLALGALIIFLPALCHAEGILQTNKDKKGNKNSCCLRGLPIIYDEEDFGVVRNVSAMLGEDIGSVTGVSPEVVTSATLPGHSAIVIRTIGKSRLIEKLMAENQIPADSIAGEWERFLI